MPKSNSRLVCQQYIISSKTRRKLPSHFNASETTVVRRIGLTSLHSKVWPSNQSESDPMFKKSIRSDPIRNKYFRSDPTRRKKIAIRSDMNAYCISNYQSNVPQDRLITLANGDKQELDVSNEGYSSDPLIHLLLVIRYPHTLKFIVCLNSKVQTFII